MTFTTGLVPVPGAVIHYSLRGTGPLLLVLQGGDGDADRTNDLAGYLADRYTVLTYDRRALARSSLTGTTVAHTLQRHTLDVRALLMALTAEPARMLGSSFGALIGLEFATRYPQQVHTLIAHEPPLPHLLPEPSRSEAARALDAVEIAYRQTGWAAALGELARLTGSSFDEREPEVLAPVRPAGQRLADLEFFLENDFPLVRTATIDETTIALLRHNRIRIVPAVGATTAPELFNHRWVSALARALGTAVENFPGGHNGITSHPRAFAAVAHRVFTARDDAVRPDDLTDVVNPRDGL
ncbi:alpha/beta fold hydrolase [Nocardia sp. NPDC055321]